jgi:hypothetical protein
MIANDVELFVARSTRFGLLRNLQVVVPVMLTGIDANQEMIDQTCITRPAKVVQIRLRNS